MNQLYFEHQWIKMILHRRFWMDQTTTIKKLFMLFKLLTTHTFDELHKKLLTFETSLQAKTKIEVNFPITANPMNMTASARHLIRMHDPQQCYSISWRPASTTSLSRLLSDLWSSGTCCKKKIISLVGSNSAY